MAGDEVVDCGEISFSKWRSDRRSTPLQSDIPYSTDQDASLEPSLQFSGLGHETDDSRSFPDAGFVVPSRSHLDIEFCSSTNASTDAADLDPEYEKEFTFHSTIPSPDAVDRRLVFPSPHSDFLSIPFGEATRGIPKEDDKQSHSSSELSLQDLVERHGGEFSFSTDPIFVVFLRTLTYILIWYFFSMGLTIYNKKLLGQHSWEFPAPMLMNTIHFALQAIASSLALRIFYPSNQPSKLSWEDYLIRVVPTAIATALDIDLTNASLIFISISFETMCKSSAPVFLLLFAFAFKLEAPSFKLLGIILMISIGVLLTGLGSVRNAKSEEKHYEMLGFILVLLAAIMSGFRWTVTQLLLQKKEFRLNNPLAVMSNLAPVMAIVTAILSFATEPLHKLADEPFFNSYHNAAVSSLVLLLGGFLAFFMVWAEYLLISQTSAVTLSVAGIVREMVMIIVAVVFFGDQFTTLIGVGFTVIMVGICWFNWFKYQKFKEIKHTDDLEFERIPVHYTSLRNTMNENEEFDSS